VEGDLMLRFVHPESHLHRLFLIIVLIILISHNMSFGQIYLLNEDFQSANQTTPPSGWSNLVISDSLTDK